MNKLKVIITEFGIYGDHPPALENTEKERRWSQIPPPLEAMMKMGEMIEGIPKRGNRYSSEGGTIPTLPPGILKRESHRVQTLYFFYEKVREIADCGHEVKHF